MWSYARPTFDSSFDPCWDINVVISWEPKELLERLRKGTTQYTTCLERVRGGNIPLEKLGTDEEELEQLRIRGCATSALYSLKMLREACLGNGGASHLVYQIKEDLGKGRMTLADIGLTEKQLEGTKMERTWQGDTLPDEFLGRFLEQKSAFSLSSLFSWSCGQLVGSSELET